MTSGGREDRHEGGQWCPIVVQSQASSRTRYYEDFKILCRAPPPSYLPVVTHVTLSPRPSPPPFLHTASDQKLEVGTAWE